MSIYFIKKHKFVTNSPESVTKDSGYFFHLPQITESMGYEASDWNGGFLRRMYCRILH